MDCRYRKILRTGTPNIITVIVLQMERFGFTSAAIDAEGMKNRVDPDQTAVMEQSNLGLHFWSDLSVPTIRIIRCTSYDRCHGTIV